MFRPIFSALAIALGIAGWSTPLSAQTLRSASSARQLLGQTSLHARVNFAAGHLVLRPAADGYLYRMEASYDAYRFRPVTRFQQAASEVDLGLESLGAGGVRVNLDERSPQEAVVELSGKVELSLDVNLGAAEADLELGGLRLRDARVAAPASRTTIRFSRPNPGRCDWLSLSAGAAQFSAVKVGNSGCRRVRFEGGMGAVTLDLTGEWGDTTDVVVRMAVGEVNLHLPQGTGVELTADRFLSSFQPTGFTKDGTIYRSAGYAEATRRMRIDLTSSMGNINVSWAQ
jgi:hypothetical protein